MVKYFLLSAKDSKELPSAFAPDGTKLAHELISELNDVDELPFEFDLIKLSVCKNSLLRSKDLSGLNEIWLDYQPNSLAWPLMSEKLKAIVLRNLTGNEGLNWIRAKINGNGNQRNYYIPRFEKILDVLDFQKTMYVKDTDHIVKAFFSSTKVSAYSIFSQPAAHNLWKITSGLYISDAIKTTIQKEKLSGMDFERIAVS